MENKNYGNSLGFFETIDITILYKKTIFIFFIIFFLFSLAYIYLIDNKKEIYSRYTISAISGFESNEVSKLNYFLNEIQTSRLIKQTLILSGTIIIPHND